VRLEYDLASGAAYIRLRSASVAGTTEIAPGVLMDMGEDGLPVGFELLDATAVLGGAPKDVEFVLMSKATVHGARKP